MKFIESTSMKVVISKEQERQLSSKERMKRAFLDSSVLAFDVYEKENLIGFIMVKNFDVESYFLWNYAIDYSFQNKGYGTKTLNEFIEYMKDKYNMKVLTTTYTWGNECEKRVYEKVGFIETSIVDEDGVHEVNMSYYCK